MLESNDFYEIFLSGNKDYLCNVAVDNVIFGYHEKELKVLLIQNPNFPGWMLVGGYIKKSERAEEAALRVASQRTGIKDLFLQQFKVFSTPGRNLDPHITPQLLSQLANSKIDENHWMFETIISISFYTLVDFSKVALDSRLLNENCKWWEIDTLPDLMQDHKQIIAEALKALKLHIYHYPIGFELLPEKFTLPEIRSLYETILGKQMDDRNFTRKLLSLGIIIKINEIKKVSGHRSPNLYMFDKEIYNKALQDGIFIL